MDCIKKYDYIIVGAGLFGATFAYLANKSGKKCLVIEKRPTIGGNCYCEKKNGINIHKYGPHIFHTNDKEVWDFINSFSEFNNYINSPIANYKGELYHLPFNMNTFYEMWGIKDKEEAIKKITEQKSGIVNPQNLEEQAISMVGVDIYEKLIKGYTEKQWGRDCRELPSSIIKRIPLRFSFNNNYFNDKYQGIPIDGYNTIFNSMLEGIECITDTNFLKDREKWLSIGKKIIYTGPIDEYYEFCFGKLEYRTVEWKEEDINTTSYQGTAVINYTSKDIPFTRIIEHKYFECLNEEAINNVGHTIISKEYSKEWNEGSEPFYPINDEKNNTIFQKYEALANNEENIIFGGRLGDYKYYDMAPTIKLAMELWEKESIS